MVTKVKVFSSALKRKNCAKYLYVSILTGPSILFFYLVSKNSDFAFNTPHTCFYRRHWNCFSDSLFKGWKYYDRFNIYMSLREGALISLLNYLWWVFLTSHWIYLGTPSPKPVQSYHLLGICVCTKTCS